MTITSQSSYHHTQPYYQADMPVGETARANTLKLRLLMPDNTAFSDDVDMVVVPASEGDIGVLPGHVPFISRLRYHGAVVVFDRKIQPLFGFFVSHGIVEVIGNNVVVFGHHIERYGSRSTQAISEQMKAKEQKDIEPMLRALLESYQSLPYNLPLSSSEAAS